jgi:uncharacterized membrane protein (DUF4010 family)
MSVKKALAMAYINSILEPGEQVRYHAAVSWTIYTQAILLTICALASLVAGMVYAELADFSWFAAIVFALAATVAFLPAWFRRWNTVEMNMQKVESVDVDQTLTGRLFNYGNVTIRGTGSTFEKLVRIDSPLKLRTTVTAG